jgi:thymidylate synthase (FAD)
LTKIEIFKPHGWIELESYSGTDLDIVNAAKVSFAKQSEKYGSAEEGVLKFLMRERHGSPFEHNYFKFHVRAPIFVIREWQRHRIGSYNEESGRYVELRSDFYIPKISRVQEGSPGAYTFSEGTKKQTDLVHRSITAASETAFSRYQKMIDEGIAKEQARLVLPLNIYSEFYFSCNARSLMNFLSLRMHESAMYEIRMYANAMYDLWEKVMPSTAAAFKNCGMIAP